jgi:hypothetical protein
MALPLVVVAAGRDAQATQAVDGESFGGAWSATGTRQTLPTEGGGTAAVVHITGAIVLTEGAAVGAGFRGEAIGFDNGNIAAGRAVWTDARGDQVFSTLTGEPIRTGRRIVGTITGGTGRFAGVSGAYEMTWQYVVSGEGDAIQGRSADLRGRLRRNGGR